METDIFKDLMRDQVKLNKSHGILMRVMFMQEGLQLSFSKEIIPWPKTGGRFLDWNCIVPWINLENDINLPGHLGTLQEEAKERFYEAEKAANDCCGDGTSCDSLAGHSSPAPTPVWERGDSGES